MKRLIQLSLMSIVTVIFMCGIAFAETDFYPNGSILIPSIEFSHFPANQNIFVNTAIIVTNITDKTVKCRIGLYDQDGEDFTTFAQVYTGSYTQNHVLISTGTGDFELPPHATRMVGPNDSSTPVQIIGHAILEWSCDDPKIRKALIAGIRYLRKYPGSEGLAVTYINNGQPF